MKDSIDASLAQFGEQSRGAAKAVNDATEDAARGLEESLREHPIAVIALAVGSGACLAPRCGDNERLMASKQTTSGDHLGEGPGGKQAVISDVPERQAVTGHNVRYVLIVGLAGAVAALAIILAVFFH